MTNRCKKSDNIEGKVEKVSKQCVTSWKAPTMFVKNQVEGGGGLSKQRHYQKGERNHQRRLWTAP